MGNITQWVLDTRKLWPVAATGTPKAQMAEFSTPSCASSALDLLPPEEREKVLKFIFPRDARMSLASALLKHLAITRLASVPWKLSTVDKDEYHKPCFFSPSSKKKVFDFNVSHQAGLVSLIASSDPATDVGTDIVCVNERLDRIDATIQEEGFFSWVDIHSDVFNPSEVNTMKLSAENLNFDLSGVDGYARDKISRCRRVDGKVDLGAKQSETAEIIRAKLRRFYAFWALREAYVKMTGEALMAPWLKELEFRNVRAPTPDAQATDDGLEVGEVTLDVEAWFKGKRVDDVAVELRALGRHFVIASVVRRKNSDEIAFPGYQELDLQTDIFSAAGGRS